MPDENKQTEKMGYRSAAVEQRADGGPVSLDPQTMSVQVVAATEAPTEVFDLERMAVVREVLLMAGLEMPKNRQVPLLDSHSRENTASIIGSFRWIETEGDKLIGRVYFSEAEEAAGPWLKTKEGHLTDFSIGYRVIDATWIPAGKSKEIKNKSFTGPVKVVSRWRLKELSAVPIGADEFAKVRATAHQERKENQMSENQETKKPETWDDKNREVILDPVLRERERIRSITRCAEYMGCPEMIRNLVDSGISENDAMAAIYKRHLASMPDAMGYRGPVDDHHPATLLHDQVDKRVAAMTDGQLMRAGVAVKQPAPGSENFQGSTFRDLAIECLRAEGRYRSGMSTVKIFSEALSSRALTTGDLPYIMSNLSNKSAMIGFQETPATYPALVRVGEATNFKLQTRAKLSEADSLEEIPELGDYQYGERAEHYEQFSIATYGKIFAISRQALINDDLGLLTGIPRQHGAAARRKVNSLVLSVLTGNAAMSDGVALFHADHKNFVASQSGAAPGIETLTAAYQAMRLQTGPQGAVLNIQPSILLIPVAYEQAAWQILESQGDLTEEKSSTVKNPWYHRLKLIVDANLDSVSQTGWYLLADPGQNDVIELCYLSGSGQGPYMETKNGWTVDGVEMKVRIDAGAKALDWRTMYFNYGS